MTRKRRPAARAAKSQKTRPRRHAPKKAAPTVGVTVRMVEQDPPYAEVCIREPVTEESMERLFRSSEADLLRLRPARVLVDMSETKVALTISDLNGLAKLVTGSFAGIVERMAMVLRPADTPPEKFFEPAMINRGMPTYVAPDRNDALDWLVAKRRPAR